MAGETRLYGLRGAKFWGVDLGSWRLDLKLPRLGGLIYQFGHGLADAQKRPDIAEGMALVICTTLLKLFAPPCKLMYRTRMASYV